MQKSIGSSNEAKERAFLGLDFGKSKIGLAMADEETRMAFAFGVLENDKNFFTKLQEIIKKENIKAIIVGIPTHKDGSGDAREFGEKIAKELGVEVEFQDEMFTTKMAQENIKMRGGKNIAETDDQEAARIILQSWLDQRITHNA